LHTASTMLAAICSFCNLHIDVLSLNFSQGLVVSFLSDPFAHLAQVSTPARIIHARGEKDFERAERELRQDYVEGVKSRYLGWDLDRALGGLKRAIVNEAVIETSGGPIQRDPVAVVTRPIYDEATCVAYAFTDEIINAMREKVAVVDLALEHATRRNLETVFQHLRLLWYGHCGHGTWETLLGQGDEKIVDANNVHMLRGCMVSTMACRSGSLAQLAIGHGCIAFRGYAPTFRFFTDIGVARIRFARLSEIKRPLEAEDLRSAEKFVSEAVKSALVHDRDSAVFCGDAEARITSFGQIDKQKYYDTMARPKRN